MLYCCIVHRVLSRRLGSFQVLAVQRDRSNRKEIQISVTESSYQVSAVPSVHALAW